MSVRVPFLSLPITSVPIYNALSPRLISSKQISTTDSSSLSSQISLFFISHRFCKFLHPSFLFFFVFLISLHLQDLFFDAFKTVFKVPSNDETYLVREATPPLCIMFSSQSLKDYETRSGSCDVTLPKEYRVNSIPCRVRSCMVL